MTVSELREELERLERVAPHRRVMLGEREVERVALFNSVAVLELEGNDDEYDDD